MRQSEDLRCICSSADSTVVGSCIDTDLGSGCKLTQGDLVCACQIQVVVLAVLFIAGNIGIAGNSQLFLMR